MKQFIDPTDYDATVHRDILDALTRGDDSILDICEDRAIEEMSSYLSGRYDIDRLFDARDGERHPLVLMMCLDIAVYHIYSAGNPQKLSEMRKNRYDRAVEWMKAVQKGNISIHGAPMIEKEARSSDYRTTSNPKRCTHF